ncbi:LysM peptidoglycan-binding domain-containing protein [Metaclostridioides mangenotii]|uniref:LysM peptidoglycan-binding domain-containing protein n=1 Tax=Metaclostridioides mangenotii TaxID=1540 RepID=UPI00048A0FD9|nr:LysM peptidoglycan-binding domain-containing protein [Clostridioides mangenotii]
MEIWLSQDKDRFRFPVIPSKVGSSGSVDVSKTGIIKLGEISAFAGKNLETVELESFFPKYVSTYCQYTDFPPPEECVKKLKRWMNEGWILRLIVTDPDLDINMECIITHFERDKHNGSGDVYYSLSIEEYGRFKIPLADIPGNGDTQADQKPTTNNQNSIGQQQQQRTHTVKKGDTLWGLAKKYYGSGSKYPVIFNANKNLIKNPDDIKDGWKLVIP